MISTRDYNEMLDTYANTYENTDKNDNLIIDLLKSLRDSTEDYISEYDKMTASSVHRIRNHGFESTGDPYVDKQLDDIMEYIADVQYMISKYNEFVDYVCKQHSNINPDNLYMSIDEEE